MRNAIRLILAEHGGLGARFATLGDESDLFEAGMDSVAVVQVMMGIEDRFGVELPDSMLNRRTFSSVAALEAALRPVVA